MPAQLRLLSISLIQHWAGFNRQLMSSLPLKVIRILLNKRVSIYANYAPPPYGGVSQFFTALSKEFTRLGFEVFFNTIPRGCRICIINSYNFEPASLVNQIHLPGTTIVHRIDGPVSVYRGSDDGIDRRIKALNQEFADKTVLQSNYSYNEHFNLGISFKNASIIGNASDSEVFYPNEHNTFDDSRKIKIIASSWSDHHNKGKECYEWLDQHLDFNRYEFIFVGRINAEFQNIKHVPPANSEELANILREQDIYLTASKHESCSNSLIEALSCGLPSIFIKSGSNGELVRRGGIGFNDPTEIPDILERIVSEYSTYRANIEPFSIGEVARKYLSLA